MIIQTIMSLFSNNKFHFNCYLIMGSK